MVQRQFEQLVKAKAAQVTNGFLRAAQRAHNEAEFRTEAAKVIERFAEEAGLQLHLREEYTLFNGRADAVYNRFIVEYEPPDSLKAENRYKANQHAIDQVKQYMTDLVRRERHKEERLAGVAFDGSRYIFIRRKEGVWHIDDPLDVKPAATERFLRMLCSLSTERALIPENLIEDFGERTQIGRQVVSALYHALSTSTVPRVRVLFEQWSRQFSEVCDYDRASKVNVAGIAREYGVGDKKIDPFRLFFCIHSYYAVLIKLLAVQITHFYLAPKLGTDLHQAADFSADELRGYAQKMEAGGIFSELGIKNFLEGDFFSWYLDCWSDRVEAAIRRIISTLADYSLVTLDVDPDATRDLLKHLYQHLMPTTLRHNLGEYYTPDWLAERVLNMLEAGRFTGNPEKRLLDPACGSGTFLVLAIKAIREYGWDHSIAESELLQTILANVVGFDLNPLAVISARTNYLLALGDLLQHRRGEVTIPVYLCDSILTPSEPSDLFGHGLHAFSTAVGTFAVPSCLVHARHIDRLAGLLEESIKLHRTPEDFAAKACDLLPLDPRKDARDLSTLRELYLKLGDLDSKGVNGIWARIIKNAFAPLFAGQFDYVAGNPPWVNWSSLPEEYRQRTAPLWKHYELFPHRGLKARLGGAMDDISVLLFYVAMDRYLVASGKLGFVITQTVFKSEGGGKGFRRFQFPGQRAAIQILWVDDMSSIQVFEGATNRTAIVIARKGGKTRYPIQYGYWRKTVARKSVPAGGDLVEVLSMLRMSRWQAQPIDPRDRTSPWFTGRRRAFEGIQRCLGSSPYSARMGVHCHGNAAYWFEVLREVPGGSLLVSNIPEAGRKDIEQLQVTIEDTYLYPLARGKDVSQWRFDRSHYILVPHEPTSAATGVPEARLARKAPKTLLYLKRIEDFLRARSGYKQFFEQQGAPCWSMYNVGPYTFAPFKVVWRYIASDFVTAVLATSPMPDGSEKVVIPETKLVLIPFSSAEEAYYVCGILSSLPFRLAIMSYVVNLQIATHIPSYVRVPKWAPDNKSHRRISELCKRGHDCRACGDGTQAAWQLERIDEEVARILSLSSQQHKAILDSFRDLGGMSTEGLLGGPSALTEGDESAEDDS